ncbi:hypothetical protein D6D01_07094 [Aureobasidium pullulans]|uniref:Uncharacterized protein n=1 Tax=Aureobasidium pullulans TaxID=5580 RepID=A0A4S9KU35_AURPU|nr:hypothetical protein D6D01_07094 [Aureobasidium pullulans]
MLCKTFPDFSHNNRPSPTAKRGIYFPPNEPSAKFVWLEAIKNESFTAPGSVPNFAPQEHIWQHIVLGTLLGSHKVDQDFYDFKTDPMLKKKLGHSVKINFRQNASEDGSLVNESIRKATRNMIDDRWLGPTVAPAFEIIQVAPSHEMFRKGQQSEICGRLGFTTRAFRLPSVDWSIVSDHSNADAARLHYACDVDTKADLGWGWAPSYWQHLCGSFIIARADRQPLAPKLIEDICDWSDNISLRREAAEYITKENFVQWIRFHDGDQEPQDQRAHQPELLPQQLERQGWGAFQYGLHNFFCKAMSKAGKRPTKSHHLVFYFPPGQGQLRFIWVNDSDSTLVVASRLSRCQCVFASHSDRILPSIYGEDDTAIGVFWYEEPNQVIDPTQAIYHNNGSVFSLHHSKGPMIVFAQDIQDGVVNVVDFDMQRVIVHLEFLKPYLKRERTIESEGLNWADMIPTPAMDDEYMLNIPAAMMNLTRDLEAPDMVDPQWTGKVGNVILALPKLDISAMMSLCIYSVIDLAQCYMFNYKILEPFELSEFSSIEQARLSQIPKRKRVAREKMLERISIQNFEKCHAKYADMDSSEKGGVLHRISSGEVFKHMQHRGEDLDGPTNPALLGIGWPFEA